MFCQDEKGQSINIARLEEPLRLGDVRAFFVGFVYLSRLATRDWAGWADQLLKWSKPPWATCQLQNCQNRPVCDLCFILDLNAMRCNRFSSPNNSKTPAPWWPWRSPSLTAPCSLKCWNRTRRSWTSSDAWFGAVETFWSEETQWKIRENLEIEEFSGKLQKILEKSSNLKLKNLGSTLVILTLNPVLIHFSMCFWSWPEADWPCRMAVRRPTSCCCGTRWFCVSWAVGWLSMGLLPGCYPLVTSGDGGKIIGKP